jgi:hypothetical protein
VDDQFLEEGLVEETPLRRGGVQVCLLDVDGELECLPEVEVDQCLVGVCGAEALLDVVEFVADPGLLASE